MHTALQRHVYQVIILCLNHLRQGTVQKISEHFQWPGFEENLKPHLEAYLSSKGQKQYKRNKFDKKTLSPALRERLLREWRDGFVEFGYEHAIGT